jgi:hypothetical protein
MCNIIRLIAGDDNEIDFVYKDSDGNFIDLSQYNEIKMQLRSDPGEPVLTEISLTNGTIIRNQNVLKCFIKVPQNASGIYFGDMQFENQKIKTMGMWSFEIIEDITR